MAGFKKATKQQAKLRAAFYGPSGAGKTFTALRVATGMGGSIAVIDSERGSAAKYADRFSFDVLELADDRTIDAYVEAMRLAAEGGYGVLIIDSLSHAWQELLEEVERLAKAKYKGNTWSAWSEGTPMQRALVDAILTFPGHVIATIRSKTEWSSEKNSSGKVTPTRVGLAPEQGKGIEFEFDMLVSLSTEHYAFIEKDRTGKFQDKTIEKPGEEFGKALAAWLTEGAAAPVVTPKKAAEKQPDADDLRIAIGAELDRLGVDDPAERTATVARFCGHPPKTVDDMRRTLKALALEGVPMEPNGPDPLQAQI